MKVYHVCLARYGLSMVAFTYTEKSWADEAVENHSPKYEAMGYALYVIEGFQ